MLKKREEAVSTAFYQESKKYFEDRYDNIDWSCYPRTDHESRENEMGELIGELDIEQAQMTAVQAARGVKTDDRAKKVAIPSDP